MRASSYFSPVALSAVTETQLAANAAAGDVGASLELLRRHGGPAWRLANVVAKVGTDIKPTIQRALQDALEDRTGRSLRCRLLTRTRLIMLDAPSALDVTTAAPDPGSAFGRTFWELPEQVRTSVWLMEVERCDLGDAATIVNLYPDSVAAAAAQGRADLADRLCEEFARVAPSPCAPFVALVSAASRGTLGGRDSTVEAHLDRCLPCAQLAKSTAHLGALLRPLVPLAPAAAMDLNGPLPAPRSVPRPARPASRAGRRAVGFQLATGAAAAVFVAGIVSGSILGAGGRTLEPARTAEAAGPSRSDVSAPIVDLIVPAAISADRHGELFSSRPYRPVAFTTATSGEHTQTTATPGVAPAQVGASAPKLAASVTSTPIAPDPHTSPKAPPTSAKTPPPKQATCPIALAQLTVCLPVGR